MSRVIEYANSLVKKYNTNNPFKIAKQKKIIVVYENLGKRLGYYSKHYGIKLIHINENLNSKERLFVCGHELWHAIEHHDLNTFFIEKKTFFSTNKLEQEADLFSLALLFHEEYFTEQLTEEKAWYEYGISLGFFNAYSSFFY